MVILEEQKLITLSFRFNGGCSHLCIQSPNGLAECTCPEGYYLTNHDKDCILQARFVYMYSSSRIYLIEFL